MLILIALLAFNGVVILAQDEIPTETPTDIPTEIPTETPPPAPTETPTDVPTEIPTEVTPVETPTEVPLPTEEITAEVTTDPGSTEQPTETPLPTTSPAFSPEPPLSLLVRDLFDEINPAFWQHDASWSLVPNETGSAFQTTSNQPAQLLTATFYNVAAQARFFIGAGSAQISLRNSPAGNYTASLDAAGTVQLFRAGVLVQTASLPAAAGTTWRTLRISAMDNVVRVNVDELEVIAFGDTASLPPGDVTLSAAFPIGADGLQIAGSLLVEDFFLWVPTAEIGLYPPVVQITPAPTEEIPTVEPIVEVTAEPSPEVTAEPPPEVTVEAPVIEGKDTSAFPPPSAEQLIGIQATSNDDFANRLLVPVASPFAPYTNSGDSTGNDSTEATEPTPTCGFNVRYSFWYEFTPGVTSNYVISTAGSSFDTVVSVYTGAALGSLSQVTGGCNDDANATVLTSSLNLNLTAGTPYIIQVGGYNGRYGNFQFRVEQAGIALPALPVLTTPITATTTADTTVQLSWTGTGTSYELQVDDSATFTLPLVYTNANVIGTTETTPALAAGVNGAAKTYYWRVRAKNINGVPGAFTVARTFMIRTAGPAQRLPAANANLITARPTFTWVAYPKATYQVQVDDDVNFGSIDFNFTPAVPTGVSVVANLSIPQGTWHWRIRATDVLGGESFSAVRSFNISLLTLPANNQMFKLAGVATTINVTLTWQKVLYNGVGTTVYQVEIDDNDTFSTPTTCAPVNVPAAGTTANCVLTGQTAGNYYWRVKVNPGSGLAPANPPFRKFTISPPAPAAPLMTGPVASAILADQTPTFTWNTTAAPAGGPFDYHIQICTVNTCTPASIVHEQFDGAALNYTPPADLPAGTNGAPKVYYWRVRTQNTHGVFGPFPAVRAFTVRTALMATPVNNQIIPLVGAATTANVILKWVAVTGAVNYQIQIDDNETFTSPENLNPTPANALTLTLSNRPAGKYYWRVQADTGSGFNPVNGPGWIFFVSPAAPVAPVLTLPATATTTIDTTVQLSWNGSTSTAGTPFTYELQVDDTATFTLPLIYTNTVAGLTDTTPDLVAGVNGAAKTYYWRVRTINTHGALGAFSAARTFMVRTAPPVQSAPVDNATLALPRPTFRWIAYPKATYQVQVDNDPGFGSVDYTFTPAVATGVSVIANQSIPQGTWYWRVRTTDALGNVFTSLTRTLNLNFMVTPLSNQVFPLVGAATTANITFKWSAVPFNGVGTTSYRLQVSNNDTCASPTNYDQTAVTKILPLGAGKYSWSVQVNTGAGFVPAVPPCRIFTVSQPLPLPPVLSAIQPGALTFDTTPVFAWTPTVSTAGGPFTYILQIAPTSAFTGAEVITISGLTTSPYELNPSTLTLNRQYYWRMQTVNALGAPGKFSAAKPFKIVPNVAPNLLLPANNATLTTGLPAFTWSAVAGAAKYEIVISPANPPTSTPPGGSYMVTTPRYIPSSPLPNNTFYWQVRAVDLAGNNGPWSVIRSVKITSAANGVPILNRYTTSTPTLTWAPISWTAGGGHYEVQVDNNKLVSNNFPSPEYNNNNIANPATSVTTSALADGTWYWRVRACDPSNACGDWSTLGTFVIETQQP
ncbi:MAG: hypothetical protein K8L97_06165 [Anaerolineae bacterium]|nr:hypothetical protein [Anaerolineae bacterium]